MVGLLYTRLRDLNIADYLPGIFPPTAGLMLINRLSFLNQPFRIGRVERESRERKLIPELVKVYLPEVLVESSDPLHFVKKKLVWINLKKDPSFRERSIRVNENRLTNKLLKICRLRELRKNLPIKTHSNGRN